MKRNDYYKFLHLRLLPVYQLFTHSTFSFPSKNNIRVRNSYLSVSGVSVTHKSFVVSRNDILCHIERFVKEFKVRHVMTDIHLATLHISILFMIGRGIQYPSKRTTNVRTILFIKQTIEKKSK